MFLFAAFLLGFLICSEACGRCISTTDILINFVRDSLTDMERMLNQTDPIRQYSYHTPAFEIGFVMRTMEECYRRMVDIYNSTLTTDLYNLDAKTTDHIMFLKSVENFFWILDHLGNMLHETEKKYKLKSAGMFEKYTDFTTRTEPGTKRSTTPSDVTMTTTTKRPKQTWWKLDYGWDQMDEWR